MPTDVLILGPFEFDGWSTPEKLPFGGKQHMHVHKMPGGERVIDCLGPDDDDRSWSGILWGDSALSDALTLDGLRKAGEPLPYSNGVEARTVVISEFKPKMRKATCVEYEITVTPADGGGGGGGIGSLDAIVGSDISAAVGMLG